MKKLLLFAAMLFPMIGATAGACRKADKETAQMRYELQATIGQAPEGSAMVRVWTYSKKAKVATLQAGKNAIHGLLFKGYPSYNEGNTRIVGRDALIADPKVQEVHKDYFDAFFADGGAFQRYISFIGNGEADQILKVGKEYKVAITVIVQLDALRERLQEDGILPKDEIKGKMPIVMVVPSAGWCHQQGYEADGLPDYDKALLENQDLTQAITTVSVRLTQRGFEVKDLKSALRTLRNEKLEEQAKRLEQINFPSQVSSSMAQWFDDMEAYIDGLPTMNEDGSIVYEVEFKDNEWYYNGESYEMDSEWNHRIQSAKTVICKEINAKLQQATNKVTEFIQSLADKVSTVNPIIKIINI